MRTRLLIPFLALAFVAGCGGGNNDEPVTTGPVFITDSLDTHDHVWVTITKITLIDQNGDPVDVFNDSDGQTVDLKTLRDGTGERYAFFGKARTEVYTGARVTLDKDLVLFADGASIGELHEFEGHNGTDVEFTLTFASPRQVSPNEPLAIDFDLTNWTDNGVTVSGSPFIVEGTGASIGTTSRHEPSSLYGTVRNISGTAPNQTFRLDLDETADVTVVTNNDTVIGGLSSLQNGMFVRVRGTFQTTADNFVANSIYEEEEDVIPILEGEVTSFNEVAGSLELSVEEAEYVLPLFINVDVTTDAETVFIAENGTVTTKADFFAALANGARLEVVGPYNVTTNVLVADRIEYAHEIN